MFIKRTILWIILITSVSILGCNNGAKKAYETGRKYSRSGDNELAIKSYSEAIRSNPKYAEAYMWRASAYKNTLKYSNALEDLDRVIEMDPKNTEAYFYRGMVNATLGKSQPAASDFNTACQSGNDNACQALINIPSIETAKQIAVNAEQKTMQIPSYIPSTENKKASKTKQEMLEDGKVAVERGDLGAAFNIYKQLAASGDAYSQTMLGSMYLNGTGVPQNITEGIKWFEEATSRGYSGGQYNLGVLYLEGKYVRQDKQKALQLFEKAAKQGDGQSQINLAIMYYTGDGVNQNKLEAVKWCKKAVNQGTPGAKDKLAIMNGK